uniref:Photosystem I assembly protein Ycf4 n=1 Tax=Megaloselaginella exaltata TaxID=3140882 RepID=A0A7U3UCE5_9TRAC|nr:photosystem I assembly protein ycf4 [Selaginella exaltata]
TMNRQSEWLRVEPINGSRRAGNTLWACVTLLGALGLSLVGISSYLGWNIMPLSPSQRIPFAPQGAIMSFYGIVGLFSSSPSWRVTLWNVGSGDDRYDKQGGIITSPRWDSPGKNRRIYYRIPAKDVRAIRMEVRDGIYPRSVFRMRMKDQQSVSPTRLSEHSAPGDTEREAAELARFPGVPIEGLEVG